MDCKRCGDTVEITADYSVDSALCMGCIKADVQPDHAEPQTHGA